VHERQEGIERLKHVAQGLADLGELKAAQALRVEVPAFTVGLSSPIDTKVFNECMPHLKLLPASGDCHFTVQTSTKRVLRQGDTDVALSDADATLKALDTALHFLAAMAISTGAIIVWRKASFSPSELLGRHLDRGAGLEVSFAETPIDITPKFDCHAGQLWGAVRVLLAFTRAQWSARFLLTYHKAQAFLAMPALAGVDLYEDAFLGFFRCLEYVTMTQVLKGQRGQFDEKHLARALKALGIEATDTARKVGKRLVRRRAEASAHLAHATSDHPLEAREVLELKALVDLMIRTSVMSAEVRREVGSSE
jgi:hypothetical protein